MQILSIRGVIYFYIFICAALLLFNLMSIFRADHIKRQQRRKRRRWENYLDRLPQGQIPRQKRKKLFRKLRDVQELMAFHGAMELRAHTCPEEVEDFFQRERWLLRDLAEEYGKKTAMEKAFFAYVAAAFQPPVGDQKDPLLEQLLGYLDGSTVYSRENVLNALCAIGNIQAVEHAFTLMSQRGWYHDPRLLSDGLGQFQGEKEALAVRLWNLRSQFLECFQVGIIRFADGLPGDNFAEPFLDALETETLPSETCFALVRYFRRHAVPQAEPVLLRLLRGEINADRELAIAAASSLASYPDGEARQALKDALRSPNWYVRQNAARSLKALGITAQEAAQLAAQGERYGAEMLEYILDKEAEREVLVTA